MEKPQRYIGLEYNADSNIDSPVVTLVYPDVYELGASNFGLRVVRHLLAETGSFSVRRAFHPGPDMHRLMKERQLPWLDQEAGEPVVRSSVVGFGIASEILYTNVLSLIDLMGLQLRAAARSHDAPILLAGGGGLGNPAPLMPFMDVIFLGEAEAGLLPLMNLLCSPIPREEKLERASGLPGVLIPSLHRGEPVRWVRARSLSTGDAPVRQIVPLGQITHDRAVVELSRGCTRGCRFCQASQLSRPVRERTPEEALCLIEEAVKLTGWEQAGLLTLSYSDYSGLKELLKGLGPLERDLHARVSQPSLRPDTLPGLQAKRFFRGSLTMAPEAGTERLRRIINKPITHDEILAAATAASRMGARGIKLYFMVGLPGETDEDLLAVAALADEISAIMGRKRPVTAALSPFVPKPHTPFQWASQPDHREMWRRISIVRGACRKASVSWNDPRVSTVEGLLARGGMETAELLEEAFARGAVFDGWSDLFKWEVWKNILEGTTQEEYLPGDPLPWDMVDLGVSKEWLVEEYRRSLGEEPLPDCREAGCSGCGACGGDVPPVPSPGVEPEIKVTGREVEPAAVQRVRIRYGKSGLAVFSSHLDMVRMWTRTLRRTGLPVHYTSGYSRRVKLAFSHPVPLGMGSVSEYVDFQLDRRVGLSEIAAALKEALPRGIRVLAAGEPAGKYRAPDASAAAAEYIVRGIDDPGSVENRLKENEMVISCRIDSGGVLRIITDPGKGASRPDRLLDALGVRWKSITRKEIYAGGMNGRLVPLLPAAEGELCNEG